MIKKCNKVILFSVFLMMIGMIHVKAANYNVKVEEKEMGKIGADVILTLEGTDVNLQNYYYLVKFVNENDSKPVAPTSSLDMGDDFTTKWTSVSSDNGIINVDRDWYMFSGYDYIYISLKDKNDSNSNYMVLDDKIKIEKPNVIENKIRYTYSNVTGSYDIFIGYPYYGSNGNHNLYIKIGLIEDNKLLKEYSNNNYDNLFNYAKNDSNGVIMSCNDKIASSNYCADIPNPQMNIKEGSYYYVYIYRNDPLYRDLSSVTVAQGFYDSLNNRGYIHYLDSISTDSETTFIQDIVPNPKTSDFKIMIVSILVLFVVVISLFGRKKLGKLIKK